MADIAAHSAHLCRRVQVYRGHLHNSLERGVLERYPEVAKAKADMLHAGAQWVQLSGSGPTLFAPFPELKLHRMCSNAYRRRDTKCTLSHPVHPNSGHVCFY